MKPTRHPLRCECPAQLMLAEYGVNSQGRAYVFIAAFKGREPRTKIYSEETLAVWCRACDRYFTIAIKNDKITRTRLSVPPELDNDKQPVSVMLDNPAPTQ